LAQRPLAGAVLLPRGLPRGTFIFSFAAFPVEGVMDVAQMLIGDVRVDLSCRDIGVAEEGLHRAQVSAIFEKIGRE